MIYKVYQIMGLASISLTSAANAATSFPASLLRVAARSVMPSPDSICVGKSARLLSLLSIMVRLERDSTASRMAVKFLLLGLVLVIMT